MNTQIVPMIERAESGSPFDSIKQINADGIEFWSARDLMLLMAYARWNEFKTPLERAMRSALNQGHDAEKNFRRSTKVTGVQRGPASEDFYLTRFAAYLVAMNGDPNKPEVAKAQAYFAIQTRVAETQTPVRELTFEEKMLEVMGTLKDRVSQQAQEIEQARPAVEYHERFVSNEDAIIVAEFAAQHGMSSVTMFKLLRDKEIVYRTKITEHFSRKRDRVVDDNEHRAYAGYLKFFDLRPQHNVVRYHNGQLRQTLYVRQAFALELASLIGLSAETTTTTTKELF